MATIKVELGKEGRDGGRPVYFRITHRGQIKRLRFPLSVPAGGVKRNGDITNRSLAVAVERKRLDLEGRLIELGAGVSSMSVDEVVKWLTIDGDEKLEFRLKFLEYGYAHVSRLMDEGRENTASSYRTALNNFAKFLGGRSDIDINEVTLSVLRDYTEWFKGNGGGARAYELYMSNLNALHNMAKEEFNDEESGEVNIRLSPFAKIKYKRPRAETRKIKKRALSAEAVNLLCGLPDMEYTDIAHKGMYHIANVARDAFKLSFCLCGMNAIDLYELEGLKDGKVAYYRSKTERRSGDDAYIELELPEVAREASERNRGKKRYWNFADRWGRMDAFNHVLNAGLKELVKWAEEVYGKSAEELGLPEDLTFYAARHSWATIAANECGVPMEVVDRALCHVVESVAAQSYVKRDYSVIDAANRKVLGLVFGE